MQTSRPAPPKKNALGIPPQGRASCGSEAAPLLVLPCYPRLKNLLGQRTGNQKNTGHRVTALLAQRITLPGNSYFWHTGKIQPRMMWKSSTITEISARVTNEPVVMELNTEFAMTGMTAPELKAVVAAWQSGALSRDSMLHLFLKGEILPEGKTTEEEERLIGKEKTPPGRNH
jgi:hypothetical protein